MRPIRIFVSSPSDLKFERTEISHLVDEFNKDPVFRERYKFIALLYEEMTPSFIGEIPQTVVNQQMLRASEADLVVCMFWSRFGSPLKNDEINPDTKKPYQSGTEYEFYEAYRSYKATGKPILTLYRCTRTPPEVTGSTPEETQKQKIERYEQREKVDDFFRRIEGVDATVDGLYKQFSTTESLITELRQDWRKHVSNWMKEEDEANRPKRLLVDRLTRLLPFLIVLALLIGVLIYTIIPKVPPIDPADFNVAIAGFTLDPNSGVSDIDAKLLSDGFYKNFQNQIDGLKSDLKLSVSVWSPAQVGAISGATKEEREHNAEIRLADFKSRNLRADIIVYGVIIKQADVTTQGSEIVILPEFYVASPNPELADLLGRFDLRPVISSPDVSVMNGLSSELTNRSRILSFIAQGLTLSIIKPPQYDNAYQAYQQALNTGAPDESGKELVRILMGNARLGKYNQINSGDGTPAQFNELSNILSDVQTQFTDARKIKPDFSRAYLGLATTRYLQLVTQYGANEIWSAIPEDDIVAIEKLAQMAMDAKDKPESADVPTKYAFIMGQAQLVRYKRGDSSAWDKSKGYFDQVITDYGKGANKRIQEFAAQANSFIALLYRGKNEYDTASTYYQTAIGLTLLDVRKQLFNRSILEMNFEQSRTAGDIDKAMSAVNDMLRLKMLPQDKAILLFQEGKMLSENDRDQESLVAYKQGVSELDDGVSSPDNVLDKTLAAQLWAVIGDKQADLNQMSDAVDAYKRAMLLDLKAYGHLDKVINELSVSTSTP